jgi:hypothetical protein
MGTEEEGLVPIMIIGVEESAGRRNKESLTNTLAVFPPARKDCKKKTNISIEHNNISKEYY